MCLDFLHIRDGVPLNLPREKLALEETTDLAGVQSFYNRVGYDGGAHPDDRLLVLRENQSIVAAVRLCTEQGTLVLRGMYVAEERRGQGLGSMLLGFASPAIGSSECWCVPYTHLADFYSRIGFHESESVPGFLAKRRERYMASGRVVSVMWRPSG